MTNATNPTRIPIGRNITYAVRGMPEVPNAYGPGYLIPTEISLTYRATEDSQLGRFHAYVKGQWRRDGEVVPSGEKLPGQHYYGDPSTWPAWLAEEARLHDPDTPAESAVPAPATDETVAQQVARHLDGWEMQSSRTRVPRAELARELVAIVQASPAPATDQAADVWVACSPEWLAANPGQCGTAPRIPGPEGISHLHPAAGRAPAAVCICGHTEQQHVEDACLTEITGCGCGDFLTAETAAEERVRTEAAIHALRSAAEHARTGVAVGPIPLEVRPAVAAWLCRLADQRRSRAIAAAAALAEQQPTKGA